MKITLEEAARIARLAHLSLPDEDLARMRGQLDLILEYMGVLAALDPGAGPAGAKPAAPAQPLRGDQIVPSLDNEETLAAAPESGEGYFKVPRVLA